MTRVAIGRELGFEFNGKNLKIDLMDRRAPSGSTGIAWRQPSPETPVRQRKRKVFHASDEFIGVRFVSRFDLSLRLIDELNPIIQPIGNHHPIAEVFWFSGGSCFSGSGRANWAPMGPVSNLDLPLNGQLIPTCIVIGDDQFMRTGSELHGNTATSIVSDLFLST